MDGAHHLLDDRVILISGVGPGLGRACAEAALREGARVALGDLDGSRLEALVGELGAGEPDAAERVLAQRLDITAPAEVTAMVAAVERRWGRIDGVVHVAAYDTAVGGVLDGDLDDWDRVAEVNVRGTLGLTRAAVPLMPAGGSIVIIGSIGATRPRATSLRMSYGISKGALLTAARYLTVELGPRGIRVNTVAPGWKWGPVLEGYLRALSERSGRAFEDLVDELKADSALHEIADDHDVADSVVYFLCDLSRRVSGQIVYVDAGSYLP